MKPKTLLLNQFFSTVDPEEQACLRKLLVPIKDRLRNSCRAEKERKSAILKNYKKNLTRTQNKIGKETLVSKSDDKLTVDQLTLGKFKSASVKDKFYDILLNPLEGALSSPNLKAPLFSKSLSFPEFSTILSARRNTLCPGVNAFT